MTAVLIAVFDGVQSLDVTGPLEVFAHAGGVSSGIDMALALAGRIAGDQVAQSIQLSIEYDPQPPYDAGSPAKAPAQIVAAQRATSRFLQPSEV